MKKEEIIVAWRELFEGINEATKEIRKIGLENLENDFNKKMKITAYCSFIYLSLYKLLQPKYKNKQSKTSILYYCPEMKEKIDELAKDYPLLNYEQIELLRSKLFAHLDSNGVYIEEKSLNTKDDTLYKLKNEILDPAIKILTNKKE